MTQNTSEELKYFDLHVRGIGYLNRIREVQVRRGPGFMACDIAALYGPADAVQYTRFDCKVTGAEAERLVRRCWDAVNAQKKCWWRFASATCGSIRFSTRKAKKPASPGQASKPVCSTWAGSRLTASWSTKPSLVRKTLPSPPVPNRLKQLHSNPSRPHPRPVPSALAVTSRPKQPRLNG